MGSESVETMRRFAPALALAIAFVAVALAGCQGKPATTLSTEEAPDGPDSLRVGPTSVGEQARMEVNATGHRWGYNCDESGCDSFLTAFKDHNIIERNIELFTAGEDAFLRDAPLVLYTIHKRDLDPEEFESSTTDLVLAYEMASERLVYEERHSESQSSYTTCDIFGCNTVDDPTPFSTREYPRDEDDPARWGSLEGRVLHIGQDISFRREVTAYDGDVYYFYLNYSVLREDTLNGERTFVLKPYFGFEDPTPEPQPTPSTPPMTEEPTPSPTKKKDPPPTPIHLLWYSSRSPLPVQEVENWPFEYEGRYYWQNTTSQLVVYEPGSTAVPWGSGNPLPALARRDGTTVGPASTFLATASEGLTYPLAAAWAAIQNDATLTDYQSFVEANPDAVPMHATYYPDLPHNAYTWSITVGEDWQTNMIVESRLQFVGPTPITQNREGGDSFGFFGEAPSDEVLEGTQVVSLADALDVYETLRGDEEPIVTVDLSIWWEGQDFEPKIAFFPVPEDQGGLPTRFDQFYDATDSVDVLMTDGGLWGFNTTWGFGMNEWPWISDLLPFRAANGPSPPQSVTYGPSLVGLPGVLGHELRQASNPR